MKHILSEVSQAARHSGSKLRRSLRALSVSVSHTHTHTRQHVSMMLPVRAPQQTVSVYG